MRKTILISLCAVSLVTFDARAEIGKGSELSDLKKEVKLLNDTVKKLSAIIESQQQQIDAILQSKIKVASLPEDATPPVESEVASVRTSSSTKGIGTFLPDIGIVGDITTSLTESDEDEEGNDRISLRELELIFGHDIDPYSRFDATVTFSDFEEASVEEAYVSYWGLPGEIKGKIGRLRPKIGKVSALHRDSLDTVDEPFVVQRYLGVEGLSKSGLELSGFLPLPSESIVHALTLGVMEGGVGEDGELFGETRRRPSFYGHLSNFFDISEDSNFEIGGTYLLGSGDEDSSYEVNAFGSDITYIYYVTPRNKLKFQSEVYLQDRSEDFGFDSDGNDIIYRDNPVGFYSLLDYRLTERWGIGGRYDYVEPTIDDPENTRSMDSGWSPYLTFYQSEFARWRTQYSYVRLADGSDDNRFFLQGTFAIGTHKHQLQ